MLPFGRQSWTSSTVNLRSYPCCYCCRIVVDPSAKPVTARRFVLAWDPVNTGKLYPINLSGRFPRPPLVDFPRFLRRQGICNRIVGTRDPGCLNGQALIFSRGCSAKDETPGGPEAKANGQAHYAHRAQEGLEPVAIRARNCDF